MAIYIQSFEAITPQNTFNCEGFLTEIVERNNAYFSCVTPKYNEYLDPKALRRMSKIVRMGTCCAKVSLQKAELEQPDAIIVGTGLGCVEDTVKFLAQLIDNNEQLLNPTAFIQSTHNTVSGQIALMLGCRNYNLTYTQKTISFESALLDAFLMLKGNEAKNILVGGIDEVTDDSYRLIQEAGCARNANDTNATKGFIPGEGSAFFVLSNEKSEKSSSQIIDINIIHQTKKAENISNEIERFLKKNNLSISDIDVVVSGINGDAYSDKPHLEIKNIFPESAFVQYKHLVGEFDTASAFGFWAAAEIMKTQTIPESLKSNGIKKSTIKNILLYNSFNQADHAFILVSQC